MKTIFFIIPIGIITDNIFRNIVYPDYCLISSLKDFSTYFPEITFNAIYSFLIFSFVFLVAYYFERRILPAFFLLWKREIKISSNKIVMTRVDKNLKKIIGFNPYSSYLTQDNVKRAIYPEMMYIPITLILWLIAINTFISYLAILFVIFITIYMVSFIEYLAKNAQ